jgi:hypothetical protein
MKTCALAAKEEDKLRFIAVSATIPNISDV